MGVGRASDSPAQREVVPVVNFVVVSLQIKSSPLTLTLHIATGIPSGFGRHTQDLLLLGSFAAIQG